MSESAAQASNNFQPATTITVLAIALAVALLHLLTNSRYGFHRDELQVLSDALHLDWGFVAYPPFTPFVERISMALFGLNLVGLRLFSVIAQAVVIVVSGRMARQLGGGRLAQIATALAVALAPLALFEGTEFQYTTFDYLWWVLAAYFAIRLLKSENPRWWLAIGAVVGLGLMTKYTMAFLLAGILGGLLLTPARRYLASKWLWAGVLLMLLICLPNLVWQAQHGLVSYHFLRHIHARDVGEGRANGFWLQQFVVCANLAAAPLWIGGLLAYLRSPRYRLLAWMYLIPLALFLIGQGRGYYLGSAYPMLVAMGAVAGEAWLAQLRSLPRRALEIVFFACLGLVGLNFLILVVPLANRGWTKRVALKNNTDLREEIGWNSMVRAVAAVRARLPPAQQASLGILVGNYGEQGAIEILGRAYGLPAPISLTNSAWLRGYPQPPPDTLIVLGFSLRQANQLFTACRLAGHNGNTQGVVNEESQYHPDIFLCGPPRQPWPQFWKNNQRFG
ncbi:MAG TPA: glycosyltransferase family 39 protein [Terriglobales bacterium]|nr:glycosyltransferase family 39 protein [Terriglobales bacterium]